MDAKKIKVLYIDDEMANLLGFKASFRTRYDVFIASTPPEALEILEKNPEIIAIFCDQRMPEITGSKLFEIIRGRFQFPIRMLITGFSDIEAVIEAINCGHIFRYIKKPWEEHDIISAIDEAHKFYLTTSMLTIKNEELKKAYNELDKFAYSVTHDLHGPIVSISGAIDLLRKMKDDNATRDMLRMIQTAVDKLDLFIGSIHDYYKVKRGELQIEVIDFKLLIEDLRDVNAITEKLHNIKFNINLKQDFEFRSDPVSIRLILNNLLSNAFKYQRKDNNDKFVDLSITVDKHNAVFKVKDNGIGIKNEYLDMIYNMFFRATSEEIGSGFGLYNVKDVLKKLDGTISVKSTPQVGTEFEVTIPSKR